MQKGKEPGMDLQAHHSWIWISALYMYVCVPPFTHI